MKRIITIIATTGIIAGLTCAGKSVPVPEGVSAEALYGHFINNPNVKKITQGEFWAWHACGGADLFVKAYEVWKDPAWIEYGCKYYDGLLDNLVKDPDGYLSTFQEFGDKGLWTDAGVTDALLATPMLKMAEVIRHDPALKAKYGDRADRYVAYAEKDVFEKWEKRGLWHEQGEYGNFLFGNMFLKENGGTEWVVDNTVGSALLGNKYNISNKLGRTLIVLWRLTGTDEYRDMAEKMFYRTKADMQRFDGHAVWPYWAPYYPGDMKPDGTMYRFWSSVHPYRAGYKAEEVAQIVYAYQNGIVFNDDDLRAIIKTNLDIMWNGDSERPAFRTCDGQKPDTAGAGAFLAHYKTGNAASHQGALWSALAPFDATIRTLYEKQLADGKGIRNAINKAYYETFVEPHAPAFTRTYVEKFGQPVVVKDVAGGNSPDLVLTTVLPYRITVGEPAYLVAKSKNGAKLPLEVALYDRAGKKKLKVLHTGALAGSYDGQKGVHVMTWDAESVEQGKYRIRWTLGGGFSDRFVEVL